MILHCLELVITYLIETKKRTAESQVTALLIKSPSIPMSRIKKIPHFADMAFIFLYSGVKMIYPLCPY